MSAVLRQNCRGLPPKIAMCLLLSHLPPAGIRQVSDMEASAIWTSQPAQSIPAKQRLRFREIIIKKGSRLRLLPVND